LKASNITSVLGRMILIHQDKDDLGKGENDESKKTGNAGKRLACGIIAVE
jgi:Cu-Zn family superoxide dismutase